MIYYLGYYDDVNSLSRWIVLSAVNKIDYICSALGNQGNSVCVISCSMSKTNARLPAMRKENGSKQVIYMMSLGRKSFITKALDKILMPVQLAMYLLHSIKSEDTLLVYHATSCMGLIRFIKKLKKCTLILEMEELYSDVNGNKQLRCRELAMVRAADALIFPTQLLNEVVNTEHKPFAVVHGTYQIEPNRNIGFEDGKIHVVYAGTLDPRKGGGRAAAAAAQYLPANYHVHILGFGSDAQVSDMKNLVADVAQKSEATITYDGVLSGEDYIRFIQSCHIGLSTQNPDAAFNATSFPSKVLSYMANGLRVVSVRIPAVELSAVGDLITYYDKQTPEDIAKAIISVDMTQPYDSRVRIAQLDTQFQKELKTLIEATKA